MQNAPISLTSFTGQLGLTMSSREIAELTGKEHKNVLADVRKMLEDLKLTSAEFSADLPDSYGRLQAAFKLPKRETLILVSGYSTELRARIIDRWQDLESTQQPQALPAPRQAACIIESDLHIANLLGVPIHFAQSEAVKHARLSTGYDVSHLLQFAPAQSSIPDTEVMLEPTELARELGYSSAVAMNKALAKVGLQVSNFGKWEAIGFGASISARHQWVKGGKTGYNLKWNVAKVRQALEATK